jgi:hypothetical protein
MDKKPLTTRRLFAVLSGELTIPHRPYHASRLAGWESQP